VIGEASRGRKSAGVPFLVARAFQPEFCGAVPCLFWLPEWQIYRAGGPLTPDPSPPFHGGEGRIGGDW
jgi:hypothetical protein